MRLLLVQFYQGDFSHAAEAVRVFKDAVLGEGYDAEQAEKAAKKVQRAEASRKRAMPESDLALVESVQARDWKVRASPHLRLAFKWTAGRGPVFNGAALLVDSAPAGAE